MYVNALLNKRGLKFEDLTPEEQETLNTWISAIDRGQINIPVVREYISKMKDGVVQNLSEIDDIPNDWLTVLCFFIPIIGIIRKWYLDQKKLALIARLKNYTLLDAFLASPQKAQKALEKVISSLPAKN